MVASISMHRPTVLVAGHMTHDRHASGLSPGGCAFYAAEVYRRLGADVRLAITVGRDFQFDSILADLGACHVTRSGQTTVFANIYPEYGPRVQLIESVAPPVDPQGIAPELLQADIVHLAPVMGEIDIAAWRRVVRAKILAINVQGWVRRVGAPVDVAMLAERAGPEVATWARGHYVEHAAWEVSAETLAGVDVAFLSHEDLDGQYGLLDRLLESCSTVNLTAGRLGCEVFETRLSSDARASSASTRCTRVGVYPTDEVEATGAGDTFAAGFLFQLARGQSPVEAARFGAAAASIAVEGMGASPLDRMSEAWSRVASVPVLT